MELGETRPLSRQTWLFIRVKFCDSALPNPATDPSLYPPHIVSYAKCYENIPVISNFVQVSRHFGDKLYG